MSDTNTFKGKVFKKISQKLGKAIELYNLIENGDRILIGLSGGKDSFVMTHLLHNLQKKAPVKFELEVVTFDPKFEEFNLKDIKKYADNENWKHHVRTLDIAEIIEEKEFTNNPCMLCSRLRRGYLYKLAKELNCNKLALGHHLDDAIISFMMSYFRGQGLTTMGPNVTGDSGNIRIIRPLILTEEDLIIEFAKNFRLPNSSKCKYAQKLINKGDRVYFQNLLKDLELKIPDFRANALKSMSNIQKDYLF